MQNDPNRSQPKLAPREINGPVLRVLVVEDEVAVREGLAIWLGQRQFSVHTASDLRSAMNAATNHSPDVILLDVKLGLEDGLRLLDMLRSAGIEIPCVVLTAHSGPHDGFKAHELGVVGLLEKPSSPDEIAFALRAAATSHPFRIDLTAERTRVAGLPMVGPVRDRIAAAVVRVVASEFDLKTIGAWARHVGVAEGTLKGWCATCEISPGDLLMFARLLRAVTRQSSIGAAWMDSLELMDSRTARRWFSLAFGPSGESFELPKTSAQFLQSQEVVADRGLVQRIRTLLGNL